MIDRISQPAKPAIPLALKLIFSAFVAVLVPVYWHNYGPTNFLYFCDASLFITLMGIWSESALLVSIPAVGIIGSQALWVLDFAVNLMGWHLTGMTDYMFDPQRSLFLRGLSLFHGWLPFLLVFLVARLGYDKRALPLWTALAWALVLICYFFMPPPSLHHGIAPVNIDYAYGMSDTQAQTWMPPDLYVAFEMVALLLVLYVPVHLILSRFFSSRLLPGAVSSQPVSSQL
jgi:hypothetical protein